MNEEDFLNEMKEQEEDMDFFYDDVPESPIELDYITHEQCSKSVYRIVSFRISDSKGFGGTHVGCV